MSILKYRRWLYFISLLTLGAGIGAIVGFGIPKGIDFTGGTVIEINTPVTTQTPTVQPVTKKQIEEVVYTTELELKSVLPTSVNSFLLKFPPLNSDQLNTLQTALIPLPSSIDRIETVGPSVSAALTERAVIAVLLTTLALIGYIAYAFRGLERPLSPWRFGITAVIAMIHDVAVVLGIFALLARFNGHVFEADSNLVAALLTVVGFSVHDTIVVFDRIRENRLKGIVGHPPPANSGLRAAGEWFERLADQSLLQTLIRSLNTSITTLLALLVLLLFGGPSIQAFTTVLFVGIFTGTYSSIFVATPLLVDWQHWLARRAKS